MGILRTAQCDICKANYTESDFGLGFPGWVQISGIGKVHKEGEPYKHSDSNVMLCPHHGARVAELMTLLEQEQEIIWNGDLNGVD